MNCHDRLESELKLANALLEEELKNFIGKEITKTTILRMKDIIDKHVQKIVDSQRNRVKFYVHFPADTECESRILGYLQLPRYTHDCNQCKFLGHYEGYDLYYCDVVKDVPTVIARFGNNPTDYFSGLDSSIPPLIEAQSRFSSLSKGK